MHITLVYIVLRSTVKHPGAHNQQHPEKSHEVAMVLEPNAVADPGAMVIETGYTAVADRTVLGTYGTTHQASRAEGGGLKSNATTLR